MTSLVGLPFMYVVAMTTTILMSVAFGDVDTLHDSNADTLSNGMEDFDRPVRQGNFVRIGRANSFVRIGKMKQGHNMEPSISDLAHKESPNFIRNERYPHNIMNRFIRIGRNDYHKGDEDSQDWLSPSSKRSSSFVRIGKSDKDNIYDKKASGFVRIGKSYQQKDFDDKRGSGFVRIGKDWAKRPSGFVRIGKDFETDSDFIGDYQRFESKRVPGFVRFGKSFNDAETAQLDNEKRGSGFVRIGKSDTSIFKDDDEANKRASGFVRIGKSSVDDVSKRVPGFVRIGKSSFYDNGVDLDDPLFSFNRGERSAFNDGFDKDNLMSGNGENKRASGFVRIGKSDLDKSDNINKRASSFVRIGKSLKRDASQHENDRKRNSGFVRIGKQSSAGRNPATLTHSSPSGERMLDAGQFMAKHPIALARRGSAFVRIGKIPSAAFVPLGKDIGRILDVPPGRRVGYMRRSRNGQSSFVRIG